MFSLVNSTNSVAYTGTAPIVVTGSVISSTAAGSGVAGHVTAGAQTFSGAKTFEGGVISTVASGSTAFRLETGARIVFDGAAGTRYLTWDVGTSRFFLTGDLAIAGTVFSVSGIVTVFDPALNATFRGGVTNGASAVAVRIGTTAVYSTQGSKVAAFQHSMATTPVTVASIGGVAGEYCITTHGADAVAGDSATSNTAVGKAIKDTTGTTFTLTNSVIATTSKVIPYLISSDATAKSIACAPGSGSAVFTFNAAPTANCTFGWFVINV